MFAPRSTILLLALACLPAVSAPPPDRDPDSPQVLAAAHAALANAKILDISGKDLAIQPFDSGMAAALKDLGAQVTTAEIKIDLDADALFDPDKYVLRPAATDILHKVALVVSVHPDAPLLLEAYTEGKTGHPNVNVSTNRAEAVKKWLVSNLGIKVALIKTAGLKEPKPVAPNTAASAGSPQGLGKNRVELTLPNT